MIPIMCGAAVLMGFNVHALQDAIEDAECSAVEVVASSQGQQSNGSDVPANRSDVNKGLGAPDMDNDAGGFYSLGINGSITLQMGGAILNQPGVDLLVFETSFSGDDCSGPNDETATVEVSQFGSVWYSLGEICRDGSLDIDGVPVPFVTQVRITDTTEGSGDGWDLDGVTVVGGCIDMEDPDFCYGSNIVSFDQGLTKDGGAVDADRSDETQALGKPEMTFTRGVENFVSLGYGGTIIIGFDGVVMNEPGDDILVQEITGTGPGATAPWVETAEVSVSADNVVYYPIGTLNKFEAGTFDISNASADLPLIRFVKVEDISPEDSISGDGFDLDGIIALNGCSNDPFEEPEVCNNFDYFIIDKAEDNTISLYSANTVGGNSELTLITEREVEISLAYDQEENLIYGIDRTGSFIEVIEPITGAVINTILVDEGFGDDVFSAVYRNGLLYAGSGEQDRVVAIDITDGSFVEVTTEIPISGGDLAFVGNELYITTKDGDDLYRFVGGSPVLVGSVPENVHGASVTPSGQIAMIARNSSEIEIFNTDGTSAGALNATLNGESFTFKNGDFTGGCNIPNNDEPEECLNFSSYYVDIPVPTNEPATLYSVRFFDGSADLITVAEDLVNRPHIAFNPSMNVIYAVDGKGKAGSFDTIDLATNTSTTTALPSGLNNIHSVVYFNGFLFMGSSATNEIYQYNIATESIVTIATQVPVQGGDLVVVNEQLYLATKNNGGEWYLITGGSAVFVTNTPGNGGVNGAALTSDGDILFSNFGESRFITVGGNQFDVYLDGELFTLRHGDLATGCNLQNNEEPVPAGCYAANVLEYIEGTERNGGEIATIRTETPENVLGEPEGSDEFVFTTLGYGGSITLTFDGSVQNVPGPDLLFVETTFGNTDCDSNPEFADIYVSITGEEDDYFYAGTVCKMNPTIDISDAGILPFVNFVKVVNNDEMTTTNDGYDLDGVVALGTCVDFDLETFLSEQNATLASNSQDALNSAVEMWPVPATNQLNVKLSTQASATVSYEIVSITGQSFNRGNVDTNVGQTSISANISNLAEGTYFFVMNVNGSTVTKQFVKAGR